MKIESVMSETASVKSEVKRAVEAALKSHYEPHKH